MKVLVLPFNVVLGGVMFSYQRRVFKTVNLRVRKNRRGLLFYFFCHQFVVSPISLAGYSLEAVRTRRAW
jgi:biofilm PGA synthesis N-glycosyltransferase PgaC